MSRKAPTALTLLLVAGLGAACAGSGEARSSSATTAAAAPLDTTRLVVGDQKYSTSGGRRGYVYVCQSPNGMPGGSSAPWITGSTWSLATKPKVSGSVHWSSSFRAVRSGSSRRLTGNGLPRHTTGVFPISSTDAAYQYDRNPNRISSTTISATIPASPRVATRPGCTSGGPVGILDSGAALFNALDAGGNDAAAREVQDRCDGHPQQQGQYHYHALPRCLYTGSTRTHSIRIGWALDGFPIYGPRGTGGHYLRNSELDACHGHTHVITIDGRRVRMYHYHATMEFPYTVGCYRGIKSSSGQTGPVPTGPPQGGPPPA